MLEELDNEKYSKLENIENLFKSKNCFGNEYNYCFATFKSPSVFFNALGIFGAILDKIKSDNVTGYFVNKYEKGICLIPLVVDDDKKIKIDINNFRDIRKEDIKKIKVKTEDFTFKKIVILLNDGAKYKMVTASKIVGVSHHELSLKRFIESCKK